MSILQLTSANFHQTVAEASQLVVEFGPGPLPSATLQACSGPADYRYGHVDTTAQPELVALFGLPEDRAFLIFREQVVLYLGSGEHSAPRIGELMQQVRELDMTLVRADLAEANRAEVAVGMRRICPTARRGAWPGNG